MKYLTFTPAGGFPFAILFNGHVPHRTLAEKIGQPVQGAGFVTVPDAVAFPGGFSTSLGAGVHRADVELIQGGLWATEAAYPPPPAYVSPHQRLAAIRQALTAFHVELRNGVHGAIAQECFAKRVQQILGNSTTV